MKNKFDLGMVYMTRHVLEAATANPVFTEFIWRCMSRHANGDWGDLCEEDKKANNDALTHGNDQLLSSFTIPLQQPNLPEKLWIITEWDRSCTTVLFPFER